jgi:hypothetical protein
MKGGIMQEHRKSQRAIRTAAGVAGALALGLTASAARAGSTSTTNTLHGFCQATPGTSGAGCSPGTGFGPTFATTQNPLSPFGFTRAPDSNSGLEHPDIDLVVLIPDTGQTPNTTFGSFTGHNTGVTTAQSLSLFSTTAWSTPSEKLAAYLGVNKSGGDANPLSAFQNGPDAGASFFLYQADFGSVTFGSSTDPYFTDSTTVPVGTVYLALATCSGPLMSPPDTTCPTTGTIEDSIANSSAITDVVTTVPVSTTSPPPIPEPSALALLGSALAAMGFIRRRRKPVRLVL